jgi:uncharacterized membrane protein
LVSYAGAVQPVLNAHCTACHTGSSPPAGKNFTSYANTIASDAVIPGNASGSRLYQRASSGHGIGQATAAELQAIADWINQGALNN